MSKPQVLYRWLLAAYPRSFRRRYAEMALADFGVLHHDTARQRGLGGVVLLWLRTVPGVLRDGLRERRLSPGPAPLGSSPQRPDTRPRRWFSQARQDVRYGARSLLKTPGFTVVAILTIATGMAANATIYGMVYEIVFAELPYGDYEDLAIIWTTNPERGTRFNSTSVPDWADVRARSESFDDIAFHEGWEVNLTGGEEPVALTGYKVTPNTFAMLRVEPLLGRALVPSDGEVGAEPVVVLSWRLWQRLGAEAEIVGTALILNETEQVVAGVMPERFEYPQLLSHGDLWSPTQLTTEELTQTRRNRHVIPVGRLAAGADIDSANAELIAITEQLAQEYPASNEEVRARAISLRSQMAEPMASALVVLLATVAFVLLICCANVANLFLARATSRQGEIAIRSSLGASRVRLVRQLLTEALLVALAGGLLGVLGAEVSGRLIVRALPDLILETSSVSVDGQEPRVLLLTFVVAAVAGIIFGLAPALRASQVDLQGVLRASAGFGGERAGGGRLRKLLVVTQVSAAVVLIAGAGLMVKGFAGLLQANPGFDPAGVLTMQLALNGPRYDSVESRRAFYREATAAIDALPGAEHVGASSILPLGFSDNTTGFVTETTDPENDRFQSAGYRLITPGYLEAMAARLVSGRLLEPGDTAEARHVVVVNEALLRHLPTGNPIGMRIRTSGSDEWMTIVGVVGSFQHSTLLRPPAPAIFMPYEQTDARRRMFVAIRTDRDDPEAVATAVRSAIWSVDPAIPVDDVRTLAEIVDTSLFVVRFPTTLVAVLGVTALLLAAVGLYGVISYLVAQRSREVGIRLALGAQRGDVLRLVLRNALVLAGIGIALGLLVAVPMGRALASFMEGVSASDPLVILGVPVLLVIVTLLATLVPARRALAVDPVVSLKAE